ncbi:protein of unknown function DUF1329 [Geobacter metallireducens GS-15]|uniref:DUF1329 domain-containing protein n=1 Tax=Geobacter metallireducens (strain ATCC 53774 / DSM 7210 / GS-15) TaxID=269799 RepID=Q39TF0_GEOMG|nr:DUF1329 domain-containing protein [Geobacter metallireducens]ABB32474.1 protein of unknown function DUF1329 [Geobacter metallireducens GS-15]
MKFTKIIIGALVVSTSYVGGAQAGLPSHLTPAGAEKAGNKDGTIPAWTGGYTGRPAGFVKGMGNLPDPFASDKVLFSITGKNMDKYADKLSDGQKALLKKYPNFRMDVYQTRRSAAYTQSFEENTEKNMTRCRTTDGGISLDTSKGCGHGIPFPVPKNGYEVMWNHFARPALPAMIYKVGGYFVKPSGEVVQTQSTFMYREYGIYNPSKKNPDQYWMYRGEYIGPARINGQTSIITDYVDSKIGRRAYSYQPASRRVRLSPDAAADTPISQVAGVYTYDDADMFSGLMDRFDFKLVGKKEMYIPYNTYKLCLTKKEQQLRAGFANPDVMRWELHRVWVVEARLKPGKRHIYSKRMIYLDEDAWFGGVMDDYDSKGKLFMSEIVPLMPNYDVKAPAVDVQQFHNLVTGIFYTQVPEFGYKPVRFLPPGKLTQDSMTSFILKENMK